MKDLFSETHQIFKSALNILGRPYLSKLWGRSIRHLYAWAADPKFCEYRTPDPLKKLNVMLSDLYKSGHPQVVEGALDLITRNLDYDIIPIAIKAKKEDCCFLSEFFQFIYVVGALANNVGIYDGKYKLVSEKEKNEILALIAEAQRCLLTMERII